MNVALICPPALLKKYGTKTRYHLALPDLCHQARYRDFYLDRARAGDWIILDNGAAEDVAFGPKHLLTIADMIQANEVVVPDTLFEAEETIAQAMAFSRFARPEHESTGKEIRYVGVLQGRDLQDFMKCLLAYLELPALSYISTIALPRLMNHENRYARIAMVEYIRDQKIHLSKDIHCLGSTPNFLDEVKQLTMYPVRGIDTSIPISLGLQGKDIRKVKHAVRLVDFFEVSRTNPMVDKNIDTYLRWADYDPNN